MRAKYVQLFSHQIDGRVIYTKGGTQIIDRIWRHVREHIGRRSSASGGVKLVDARMRSAQWVYWNIDKDLWKETGEMLRTLL